MGGIMVHGGSAEFDIVWENGTESRKIPETLVRTSVQWRILDELASMDEITAMRGYAILEKQRRTDEAEAKHQAFVAEVQLLREAPEYKHLTQGGDEYSGTLAAKNMRAELKRSFPKTKFSVRKRYHGSVDVEWMDGPPTEAVKAITNKYVSADFNGMEDIENLSAGPWNQVFGGSKYISIRREYSFDAMSAAVHSVCTKFGWETVSVTKNEDGSAHIPYNYDYDRSRMIHEHLRGMQY
jgi:hypothetical protein